MTTIKEAAKAYEPPQKTEFVNIAEMEKVHIDMDLERDSFTDKENKQVEYEYFVVDGKRVKLPKSVKGDLNVLVENLPELQHFKVRKEGEGMGTKYHVVPLPN